MKRGNTLLIIIGLILILTGCASHGNKPNSGLVGLDKTLQADGYSRFDDSGQMPVTHRWLSAQQQAKLSAYRVLAEQLYYEPLLGTATVGSQVIAHEAYRVYLDLYLRQARATDYRTIRDSLKSTLQLKLSPRFYQCMSGDAAQAKRCIQEDGKLTYTRLGRQPARTIRINLACAATDCSDQFYVKGFGKQNNATDAAWLNKGFYDVEWTVNTGMRILFNYLLIHGFVNVL